MEDIPGRHKATLPLLGGRLGPMGNHDREVVCVSADNYLFVFKRGDKYVVQNRFASNDYYDRDKLTGGVEFDTSAEAAQYANGEYTEYGVVFDFAIKAVDE